MITSLVLTCVILVCMYLALTYIAPLVPEVMIQRLIQALIVIVAIVGILHVWQIV